MEGDESDLCGRSSVQFARFPTRARRASSPQRARDRPNRSITPCVIASTDATSSWTFARDNDARSTRPTAYNSQRWTQAARPKGRHSQSSNPYVTVPPDAMRATRAPVAERSVAARRGVDAARVTRDRIRAEMFQTASRCSHSASRARASGSHEARSSPRAAT